MASLSLRSEYIEVNITCIKIIEELNIFLVGNGNSVERYDLSTGERMPAFFQGALSEGVAVHGIRHFTNNAIVVFGGRELRAIDSTTGTSLFNLRLSEWILDVAELSNVYVILTMNHRLLKLPKTHTKRCTYEVYHSVEKCALYSGLLLALPDDSVLVFAGTAFREILIWPCDLQSTSFNYPLKQKLLGHNGVIFSLSQYSNEYLVSTSDDRTGRLWRSKDSTWEDVSLVAVLDGAHSSRVFRSVFEGSHVITGGEDGVVAIWDRESGELLRSYEGTPAPVWGLDLGGNKIIASSGASLTMWSLWAEDDTREVIQALTFELEDDFVKELIFLPGRDEEHAYLAMSGSIKLSDKLLFRDECLRGYGILKANGKALYVASLNGELFKFNLVTRELELRKRIFEGKIYSLEILEGDRVLLCGPQGAIGIYDEALVLLRSFQIPIHNLKQWWITCSASLTEDLVILGNRDGTLFLTGEEVITSLYRVHGKQGVGDVSFEKGVIRSIGRDGTLRHFHLKDNELLPLKVFKLNYSWMERILHHPSMGIRLLGFYSRDFIVYDPEHDKIIYKVPCGGCHRSWDFRLKEEEDSSFAIFSYIKDRAVHSVHLLKNSNQKMLKRTGHYQEINALQVLYHNGSPLLLTGGEDTKLYLRSLKNHIITYGLKSHLSNIRCLDSLPQEDSWIFVSGGGRAEIRLWRASSEKNVLLLASFLMKGNDKRRNKIWRDSRIIHDVETRIPAVCIWTPNKEKEENAYYIGAACSDGILRVLCYDRSSSRLRVEFETPEEPCCYLVIRSITLGNGDHWILSGSTKGELSIWTWEEKTLRVVSSVKAHQSGINAIHSQGALIVTGGDDGSIAQFELRENGTLCALIKAPGAHESQVTGVKYYEKGSSLYILSSGVDQKLCLWRSSDLSLITSTVSSVADVKGIGVYGDSVVVAGEGLQYFKINEGHVGN